MKTVAVLFAMVAGFTVLFGPAAGLFGASPEAKPQPVSVLSAICVFAFSDAARSDTADAPPDRLDATIRSCASLEEWLTAAQAHPDVTGGVEPRTFVARRCGDVTTGLARYATCRDLGDRAGEPTLGSVGIRAPARERMLLEPDAGVEIIFPRMAVAKDALAILVREGLAPRMLFAFRTFGGVREGGVDRCRTRLTQPVAPLDRRATLQLVGKLSADKRTSTPIAASLAAIADDLSGITGRRNVILVTDADETCGGDPLAEIERLRVAWPELTLSIVGFAVGDDELRDRMAGWAEAGGGGYFDASSAIELVSAVESAITGKVAIGTPFRVFGTDGELAEHGTVGRRAVEVEPGTYRVEIMRIRPSPSKTWPSVPGTT